MATSRKLFFCAFLHYPLRKNLQLFLISFVFLFVAFLSFLYSVFNVPLLGPQREASGGDDRNRTDDPLLAGQVLSQLSYTPIDGIPSVSPFRSLKIEQQLLRTSLPLSHVLL